MTQLQTMDMMDVISEVTNTEEELVEFLDSMLRPLQLAYQSVIKRADTDIVYNEETKQLLMSLSDIDESHIQHHISDEIDRHTKYGYMKYPEVYTNIEKSENMLTIIIGLKEDC